MPFSSSYALVLANFYDVASDQTGYYLLAFAAGNPGPLIIGPCSTRGPAQDDHPHLQHVGRPGGHIRRAVRQGALTALTQTMFWCVIFFFASAGASSAYLTVSGIFFSEPRGQAISFFFAISEAGGAAAPYIFGHLIGTGPT